MRTTRLLKIYLFILFTFSFGASKAQKVDSILSKLDREFPQEKVYLHFDRSMYAPGETIWFKAYLFAGNNPSLISKNLYFELLDAQGLVIQRKVAPIGLSTATSSFEVPENFIGSVLYIRAYTKWMLNFDSSFLYTKAIFILNTQKAPVKISSVIKKNNPAVIIEPQAIRLDFFPEGGDLVQQVESRIAFKATTGKGLPISVKGDIIDIKKNKITSFSSIHDGMGSFYLLPKSGEIYKAVWKDKTGKIYESKLPAAKQNGVVLEISNNSNSIEFKIKRSENSPLYPFVYVVAQLNQQLIYKAKANLSKTLIAASSIPTENLPSGIVQVTLFTPDEVPIAERIIFINQSSSGFITDLNTAIKGLENRNKNVIQIDVPDTIGTNLSVAVTDADLDPVQEDDDIFSGILLTNEIKGYVHKPAYYFSSDADSVLNNLDLVMLTNGWRRFKWDDVLAGQFPKLKFLPEQYLSIDGLVYGINKTLLANKEINAIIQFKNNTNQFLNTSLQTTGKFSFPDLIFYDTAKFYYQINNDKKQSLTTGASFDIKNSFYKGILNQKPDSNFLLSSMEYDTAVLIKNKNVYQRQLTQAELSKVKILKGVVVTAKKKTKQELLDNEYTSGLFSGGNARSFFPEDDPSFFSARNVLEYLQSKVAGLQISFSGPQPSVTRRGSSTALYLNEVSTDAIAIQNISMHDVALVKVFDPPFFGAFGGGAGGAIVVYQKKGAASIQAIKGLDFVNIIGYSAVKEFYSPDYSKPDQSENVDLRKTLYWNPFIITDKNNRRIFLTFYNNDITKRFKIIIEGINENGKLTRVEKIIK